MVGAASLQGSLRGSGDTMSAYVVSKRHIDTLVQSALAGPSDCCGWNRDMPFSWYHDERRHSVDQFAQGDEDSVLTGISSIEQVSPSRLGQRLGGSSETRKPNGDGRF